MAGNHASMSLQASSFAPLMEWILRARRVGLDLGGWNADFEGARLFLDGILAERNVSIAYEAGER